MGRMRRKNEQPRCKQQGIKTEYNCKSVRPKGRGIKPREIKNIIP